MVLRDAIRSLTGSDPVPGGTNLGACELAGFGLRTAVPAMSIATTSSHLSAPTTAIRAIWSVYFGEIAFHPARLPIRSLHLRKIRQDSIGRASVP